MRSFELSAAGAFLCLLALPLVDASVHHHQHHHGLPHQHYHNKRSPSPAAGSSVNSAPVLEKRGQCQFPTDAGLVAVTPDQQNAGWAMSPDQPCKPGSYCPYACPAGQLSAQWDPTATTYSYPASMNGGLFCDASGNIKKPFPNKPYCYSGAGTVGVKNLAGKTCSFCQTVLPGNEAMLIPTAVDDTVTLAVPGLEYWAGTAAHYYINNPGLDTKTACVWGTHDNPWGNWSPYVGGANVDGSGNTYMKLGWNPIWLEPATPFRNTMPDWGVRVECEGSGCNGLPCEIDPATMGVNQISGNAPAGAGGATFCVVTVPKGQKANYVIFNKGSKNSGSGAAPAAAAPAAASSPAASAAATTASVSVTQSASATDSDTESSPLPTTFTYAPHIFVANTSLTDSDVPSNRTATTALLGTGTRSSIVVTGQPTTTSSPNAGTSVQSAGLSVLLAVAFSLVFSL